MKLLVARSRQRTARKSFIPCCGPTSHRRGCRGSVWICWVGIRAEVQVVTSLVGMSLFARLNNIWLSVVWLTHHCRARLLQPILWWGPGLYILYSSLDLESVSYLVFTHQKAVQSTGLLSDLGWGPHQGTPMWTSVLTQAITVTPGLSGRDGLNGFLLLDFDADGFFVCYHPSSTNTCSKES